MKTRVLFASLLLIAAVSSATYLLTPVSAVASSTYPDYGYTIVSTIDNSGLSEPVSLDSTHSGSTTTSWLSGSGDTTPTIVFDLGDVYSVDKAFIWNWEDYAPRAIQSLDILAGSDGVNFNLVADDATLTFSTNTAQTVDFTSTVDVRYIKFVVNSNYGGGWTGLDEVKFNQVPEPATMALLGLGGLFVRRRQKA